MPSPAQRPPREIEPREFFERWLPALYAVERAGRRLEVFEVRFRLVGEGGGEWDLKVGGAALAVTGPSLSETPVTITQTVADWRALACGEDGAFDLAPPRGGALDLLFVDPALRQLLGEVRGTVRFEVTGYHGRTWAALLKLGDQPHPERPDAVISVAAETYERILRGELQPPEAYFSGRVRLHGDTGLALQLAMAMLPRFTR